MKTYKNSVIEVNVNFKKSLRNTGKAIKLLLASEVLNNEQVKFCKELQKNDALYMSFDSKVRKTKNNEVVVFYVLQALWNELKPKEDKKPSKKVVKK
jgi:hypothetical protein